MKVVVAKIGTSIAMRDQSQRNPRSAPYEVAKTVELLAYENPQNTYIVIGPNDLKKMEEEEYRQKFPNSNVITLWEGGVHSADNLPDLKACDYAIVFGGASTGVNRSGHFLSPKTGQKVSTLNMFNLYSAPAYWAVNEFRLPWVYLGLDARYIKNNVGDSSDLMIPPSVIGTLIDVPDGSMTFENGNVLNSETPTTRSRKFTVPTFTCYQYVANFFRVPLLPMTSVEWDLKKKHEPMISMNNQNCSSAKDDTTDRWEQTRRYFLDREFWTPEKVAIVGDWSSYLENKKWERYSDDPRFKGNIDPRERWTELPKRRYAALMSMARGASSGKFFEMAVANVIPLLIEDYDSACSLVPQKSWTRISSPEDLEMKFKLMESRPDLLLKHLKFQRETYGVIFERIKEKFLAFMKVAEESANAHSGPTRRGERFV